MTSSGGLGNVLFSTKVMANGTVVRIHDRTFGGDRPFQQYRQVARKLAPEELLELEELIVRSGLLETSSEDLRERMKVGRAPLPRLTDAGTSAFEIRLVRRQRGRPTTVSVRLACHAPKYMALHYPEIAEIQALAELSRRFTAYVEGTANAIVPDPPDS